MGVIEEVDKLKEREQIIAHLSKIEYILASKSSGFVTYDEAITAVLEGQKILLEKLITAGRRR